MVLDFASTESLQDMLFLSYMCMLSPIHSRSGEGSRFPDYSMVNIRELGHSAMMMCIAS